MSSFLPGQHCNLHQSQKGYAKRYDTMVHGACSLEQEQELELEQLPYGNRCCIFVEKQPIWRAPKPKIDMAE